ncbi:MAG TPA: TetR family transcriptional regulator [Alphaproteobacteria bacterium]|nr:TetR family transcriptional regulator [Alphaproteobacteria bacterium]HAM47313.1 TetR family transcriptional regulator [Alphaproteobacteria bacterium]HCO90583.1 TetR family transcriptional regulator [Alphaproteobacteria bacterium]
MAAESKRDQLIKTALELFYRDGFKATGIDKILAEAGVAKMTLYKHFPSKEALICAVLRRRDEEFRDWAMKYVETHAATPRERLLALFDAHYNWFSERNFRGCLFLNAAAEFAGNTESITAIALEHKKLLHGYIRGLASATGAHNPDELADWLLLLLDGAISGAQLTMTADWAMHAKGAAARLIDSAATPPLQPGTG